LSGAIFRDSATFIAYGLSSFGVFIFLVFSHRLREKIPTITNIIPTIRAKNDDTKSINVPKDRKYKPLPRFPNLICIYNKIPRTMSRKPEYSNLKNGLNINSPTPTKINPTLSSSFNLIPPP
jgi:hypothetical protein